MSYIALKHLHITCVVLSGLGFCLRGFWMMRGSPLLGQRWVRVAPHLIDSLLLATALTLAFLSAQYPFVQGWLTAKVCGLLAYILLGAMALKRGRTRVLRVWCFVFALLVYAYIVSVALSKNVLPGL